MTIATFTRIYYMQDRHRYMIEGVTGDVESLLNQTVQVGAMVYKFGSSYFPSGHNFETGLTQYVFDIAP